MPAELKEMYLYAFHDQTGHPGQHRLVELMRRFVFWDGMRKDAVQHVKECHECSVAKRSQQPSKIGKLHPPKAATYPWEVVSVDVLTLPKSSESTGGMSKLLVFLDGLSRWVEARPFPSEPTSEQVLDSFIELVAAFVSNINR